MRLAVLVDEPGQWRALAALDDARGTVELVPLWLGAPPADGPVGPAVALEEAAAGVRLPSLAGLMSALVAERADACFVVGDGAAQRAAIVAADELALAVFRLVTASEQLDNLGRREKPRPDLFFLVSDELLAPALRDRRYGSQLLPTGDPRRDPAAAGRIAAAIERWQEGTLAAAAPLLSVVVPAYREAQNLPLVCDRLLAALDPSGIEYEVLLVDDCSPDETYRAALQQMWRSPRIRALTKGLPRGMGNAIRHGIAQARGELVAVTMGDGSDEVARLPEMVARVQEGNGLAIGSRYRHRKNYEMVPRLYRFWSACFRLCTRLAIGLRLSDYTNAFRVFHRRIFTRYGPESGGFEISPEITFKAWFATGRVAEVDVRHLKRAAGQSSFSFLRAGPGYGKILTKAFVQRLTGRWFTLDW